MTEPIIVNGVDVSGCEFYVNNPDYSCTCYDNNWDAIHCANNLNCTYKQLQRKTAECEKLTNKNNLLESKLNQIKLLLEGKNTQYSYLKKECEKLKTEIQIAMEALSNGQYMDCEHCPRSKDKKCYSSEDCKDVYRSYFAQALERIKDRNAR